MANDEAIRISRVFDKKTKRRHLSERPIFAPDVPFFHHLCINYHNFLSVYCNYVLLWFSGQWGVGLEGGYPIREQGMGLQWGDICRKRNFDPLFSSIQNDPRPPWPWVHDHGFWPLPNFELLEAGDVSIFKKTNKQFFTWKKMSTEIYSENPYFFVVPLQP